MTTTTNRDTYSQKSVEDSAGQNVVVVVDDPEKGNEEISQPEEGFKPAGKYAGLIFPNNLKKETIPQAIKIFGKYFPNAKVANLQELLDEVGGYGKESSNPLGLLSKLTREARMGEFTAVKAPQYKAVRLRMLKHEEEMKRHEKAYKLSLLPQTESESGNENAENEHKNLTKQEYLQEMQKMLKLKSKILK